MTLSDFTESSRLIQEEELFKCCGSTRWVEAMLTKTASRTIHEMLSQVEHAWETCGEADWKEAFTHHPKIGDIGSLKEKFASTSQWASGEQASMRTASDEIIEALAEENKRYEDKFGFIFIVCATGKSATEMLEILRSRLPNTPDVEIQIAAQEQLKITKLRLQKLFAS